MREEVKPELSRLSETVRAEAELSGRRNARGAFNRIASHGYGKADRAFLEIGILMLVNRTRDWEMPEAVAEVWLASAVTQFEALVAGHGHGSGEQ